MKTILFLLCIALAFGCKKDEAGIASSYQGVATSQYSGSPAKTHSGVIVEARKLSGNRISLSTAIPFVMANGDTTITTRYFEGELSGNDLTISYQDSARTFTGEGNISEDNLSYSVSQVDFVQVTLTFTGTAQ